MADSRIQGGIMGSRLCTWGQDLQKGEAVGKLGSVIRTLSALFVCVAWNRRPLLVRVRVGPVRRR